MIINCPIDYDETTYDIQDKDTNSMMITHKKSWECVGIPVKLPPTILRSKDRPKIQDPEEIQDTYDVVTKEDTRG